MTTRLIVRKEIENRESGEIRPERLVIGYGFLGLLNATVPSDLRETIQAVGVKWGAQIDNRGYTVDIPDEIGKTLILFIKDYNDTVRDLEAAEALGPFSETKDGLIKELNIKLESIRDEIGRV